MALTGKRVAVTGSTGGLGQAICRKLAEAGCSLILLDRNPHKQTAWAEELTAAYPSLSLDCLRMELTDPVSVAAAVEKLTALRPDIMIQNAGAYAIPRQDGPNGVDNLFQINGLAPYFLITELTARLPALHVVAVGSIAYRLAHWDPADPEGRRYRLPSRAYGHAKRWLMAALAASPLAREGRLSVVHPGISPTGITGGYPRVVRALIHYPMKGLFPSPAKAAESLLAGCTASTQPGEWIGPRVMGVWGRPALSSYTIPPQERHCMADAVEHSTPIFTP